MLCMARSVSFTRRMWCDHYFHFIEKKTQRGIKKLHESQITTKPILPLTAKSMKCTPPSILCPAATSRLCLCSRLPFTGPLSSSAAFFCVPPSSPGHFLRQEEATGASEGFLRVSCKIPPPSGVDRSQHFPSSAQALNSDSGPQTPVFHLRFYNAPCCFAHC